MLEFLVLYCINLCWVSAVFRIYSKHPITTNYRTRTLFQKNSSLGTVTIVWGIFHKFLLFPSIIPRYLQFSPCVICLHNKSNLVSNVQQISQQRPRGPVGPNSVPVTVLWLIVHPSYSIDLNRWMLECHIFIMMDWHSRHWLLLNGSERVLMTWPPGCQPPHTQTYCESKDWS